MKCPYCAYENSKVLESRLADEGTRIRRRRECEVCFKRFTTFEAVERIPILVVKRNGIRVPFERKKIFTGIFKACEKRAISPDQIDKMTDEVEYRAQNSLDREISSQKLGDYVMDALKKVDEVAYIRFAAVYKQFKDVKDLMAELKIFLSK